MLYGRRTEQTVLDELVHTALGGRSGVLVLRGEPGIGKTALLDYAAGAASGTQVIRGAGVEAETDLPYAGLHLLLRPVLHLTDRLPEAQRDALRSSLGLGTIDPDARFLVALATLSLLTEAAAEGPLLCLIDDAQWLDDVSAETLVFVARRLHAEPIAMIFAVRDDETHAFPAAGLRTLRLDGLDREAADVLVRAARTELSGADRERLVAGAAGNPLALLEMRPDGDALSLTDRLREAFLGRVRRLPDTTRRLLLLAAAEGAGDLGVVLRAAATHALSLGDLEPAEGAALVRVTDTEIAFRHPLVRAAVYQSATRFERIAAHSALADALTEPEDADRRAWHLAKAASGTDEKVAAELEGTALRARARGGYEAALAAYAQAARLSPALDDQARRLVLAGEMAAETARLNEARTAAEQAARLPGDPTLAARIARVRATADFKQGRPRSAHALLTEGAHRIADADPHQELRMQLTAVNAAWVADDASLLATTAARLDGLRLPPGDPMTPVRAFLVWMTSFALDRPGKELPPLGRVVAEAREASVRCPHDLSLIAIGGLAAGHDRETRDITEAMAADSRMRGRLGWLTAMLSLRAAAETLLGEHRDSRTIAQEALRLATDTGQVRWIRHSAGILAYLAAVEGDEDGCRALVAQALGGPVSEFTSPGGTWAHWALTMLDLGAGRAESAAGRLDVSAAGPVRFGPPIMRGIPDVIEALVRAGRPADTAAPLARLEEWAGQVHRPGADALVLRCRALTAPGTEAEDHYRAALELHRADLRPFDEARTSLLYGEWLRRGRRKAEARPYLSAALGALEALGARPWAERVRGELGAAEARRSPEAALGPGLTAQERQITRLAAEGLSNREIAARLFLSPRTVGYHLSKAYQKLGIASRAELVTATADGAL
ncbi:AAA family ATPase [Actinoallomurus sp. NPDC050550]|uniref:helix-turn-helix transcriptional regulator n=1 Tax=Actinoallomurus sp. NPDC050550 TaxID=3154937 RepID=UPI0033CD9EE3